MAERVTWFGCISSSIHSLFSLAALLVKPIPFFSVRINTDDEIYFTVATARDAWIQADKNRYNGANACLLWKVFASRGLGTNAKTTAPFADGFGVPAGC